MKSKGIQEELEIPEKVKIALDNDLLKVSGEKGSIERKFVNPIIKVAIKDNKILITAERSSKREKTIIGTFKAHIKNMIKGVSNGFVYKLKICSGHFPMNVSLSNNVLNIKNFLGEKIPRKLDIIKDVNVKISGNDIIVEGIDKEKTSQTAASIEQATRRSGFDSRVFQDGIYIVSKDNKELK